MFSPFGFQESSGMFNCWKIVFFARGKAAMAVSYVRWMETGELS